MDGRAGGQAGFHLQKDTTAHEAMRLACNPLSRLAAYSGLPVSSPRHAETATGISWT